MKAMLRNSIWLNLALVGGVIFLLMDRPKTTANPEPASVEIPKTSTANFASPALPVPEPFQWRQLESPTRYRTYIANLRGIGCPEPTVQDIIRGDTGRAFAWERRQLGVDGTGGGPWSQAQEAQLEASLLKAQAPAWAPAAPTENVGNPSVSVADGTSVSPQNDMKAASAYPLFLQNVNWSGLGFTADQQAAIGQVRQAYINAVQGLNQTASDPAANPAPANLNVTGGASPASPPTPLQIANAQLSDLLGSQGYLAYEQQQYYMWYQPQVMANASGGNLIINPHAFLMK